MKLLDYRTEAINRINNCWRPEDFSTNNRCGFYDDEEKEYKKFRPCFCDICTELMDLFEISKEELKDFALESNKEEVKEE